MAVVCSPAATVAGGEGVAVRAAVAIRRGPFGAIAAVTATQTTTAPTTRPVSARLDTSPGCTAPLSAG